MHISDFRVGDRIEIGAHTDLFMRGMRYGNVTKVGRKWLHVRFDRWPHGDVQIYPEIVAHVLDVEVPR